MFIRVTISPNQKSKKVYLVEAYRNREGKPRQRIIKKYGDLDQLTKDDPLALKKLKEEYAKKTKQSHGKIMVDRFKSAKTAKDNINYGYFYIEKIYKDLGIDKAIKQATNHFKNKYDLNEIMKLLVFSRIMNPTSKAKTHQNQKKFFEPFTTKLSDIYRSLSKMNQIKDAIQLKMHQNTTEKIGRDMSLVLYDLTNYYFATEKANDLRKPGYSKERKTNPIVQMGLLIDKNKIPIGYKLFPGNMHDSKTAIPMMKHLKQMYGIKRTILVADKGVNARNNFKVITSQGDGYVVSQKVRGAKKELIDKVLDQNNYKWTENGLKYKEIHQTRTLSNGNESSQIKEKIVVYYSAKSARRNKHKWLKLRQEIDAILKSPAKLNASSSTRVRGYIKQKYIDPKTGEIIKLNQSNIMNIFNWAKYERDVALDGYYAIATSETKKPALEIIATYKELWKIEESFKVIKSDLEGRPVFVRREDHIEGHFLTCFIALTIMRILQKQLKNKYTSEQIKNGLNNAMLTPFNMDDYLVHKKSDVIESLELHNNSPIEFLFTTLEELRKVKKQIGHYKK